MKKNILIICLMLIILSISVTAEIQPIPYRMMFGFPESCANNTFMSGLIRNNYTCTPLNTTLDRIGYNKTTDLTTMYDLKYLAIGGVSASTVKLETPVYIGGVAFDGSSSILVEAPQIVRKTQSAIVRNSHPDEISSDSVDYVKVKTITFTNGLIGSYNVDFRMKQGLIGVMNPVYAKLYHNGEPFGNEQMSVSTIYANKNQIITHDFIAGDTLELWVHKFGVGSVDVYVDTFTISYSDQPTVAVASVNS